MQKAAENKSVTWSEDISAFDLAHKDDYLAYQDDYLSAWVAEGRLGRSHRWGPSWIKSQCGKYD